jgi:glyceraldehyde 3-phosphate dehydrogenase
VLITHTFGDSDFTIVFGVNEDSFNPSRHRVISTSICDASAIAPVLKVISDECGLELCFVTTLHPWLSYQNIMDGPVRSEANPGISYGYYPLGRASTASIIPKPTTVGNVLQSLIPPLKNRIFAMSYRVPTSVVASADISLVTTRAITPEHLRSLLRSIDQRLIRCSNDLLVSIDFQGETASGVVDLRWLEVREEHFIKLVMWYDNEWGYSARVIDLLDRIAYSSLAAH